MYAIVPNISIVISDALRHALRHVMMVATTRRDGIWIYKDLSRLEEIGRLIWQERHEIY